MINGNDMKNNVKLELENIEEIRFEIINNELIIYCDAIDMFNDEIQTNISDHEKLLDWSTDNRKYFIEKNYFKISTPVKDKLCLSNIEEILSENVFETYVDMCEFARNSLAFTEPDNGVIF